MTLLKRLEKELILDWQSLQGQDEGMLKVAALKAYYEKFKLYRKTRAWQLELSVRV